MIRIEAAPAMVEPAFAAAFDVIARVQRTMSFHDPDSELSRLNRDAVRAPQAVSAPLWRVLRAALALTRASDGSFDPAVGGRLVQSGQLPAPAGAAVPDPAAGWRDVELLSGGRVRYHRPLWLDLGGIAKGFAVDCAVSVLRRTGVSAGVVNAGGDLRVFGDAIETIHVRDPAAPGYHRPLLRLGDGAAATSAGYFSTRDGHSALVNARGDGSLGHGISATVCAPRAMWADALTKVVLADADAAAPLLRRLGAQAALVHEDGTLAILP